LVVAVRSRASLQTDDVKQRRFTVVVASEAKQSSSGEVLDCFVASLLAMTM